MPHVVTEPCIGVKDMTCVTVCPVECFFDAGEHMVVNPDECIDCGLCEPECPTSAIFPDTDVPEQWKHYIQINADLGRKLAAEKA